MKDNSGNKICYVKKNGLITGPFSIITLKARINTNSLNGGDMVSFDKVSWKRLDVLFPHLAPPEQRVYTAGEETAAWQETCGYAVGSQTADPGAVPGGSDPGAAGTADCFIPAYPAHPAARFFCELAVVFASVWDFPLLFPAIAHGFRKMTWMAWSINIFWAVLMVVLFGREYSRHFSWFFSPLMAVLAVVTVFGMAAGFAWCVEKFCSKKAARKTLDPEWQLFRLAVFMDSAFILNAFIALGHGFGHAQQLWVFLFLLLTVSLVVCCGTNQLRFYLERTASIKSERLLFFFPLYTVLLTITAYFLLKLI